MPTTFKDPYGLMDSGLPPELVAQLVGGRNKQKIADALMASSMKPVENMGGPGAVVSWTQGLAQIADALAARKGRGEADAIYGDVAKQASAGRQAAIDAYTKQKMGVPGVTPLTPNDDEGNAMPVDPGVKADPAGAIAQGAANPYLANSPFLKMEQASFDRAQTREDNQAFLKEQKEAQREQRNYEIDRAEKARLEQIRVAAEEKRISQAEANAQRAEAARQAAADRASLAILLKGMGDKPRLKPGERYNEQTGTVEPIPGSDLYRGQSDKHAKDFGALQAVETKTENALRKVDEIIGKDPTKPEYAKGFKDLFGGYTAYATQYLPGAQDTATKIESLKSDLKAAGLELMRAGGSIGQMTEREWPIVQDMIARISPKMSVEEATAAFNNIRAYMNRIRGNAQGTYQTEWGDSVFGKKKPAAPAAAPATGGFKVLGVEGQ